MKQNSITGKKIYELLVKQGFRCAMTGRPLQPETATLDHKIPIAKGGTHDINNLWVVHCEVNSAKGTMSTEEFVSVCRDVVRHLENR